MQRKKVLKMYIDPIIKGIEISDIRKIHERLSAYKNVINMTIGEPDTDAPQKVKETVAYHALNSPIKYSPVGGIPELREKIAKFYNETFGGNYKKDNVLVTVGSTEGLSSTLKTILAKGDEVLIPTPAYVGYEPLITVSQAKTIFMDLEENNLGLQKRNSKIRKYKSRIVSHINCELNKMIKEEDLKEIVREDLNWISKKKNIRKKQQNRFSTWSKGTLLERLSIKLIENGIMETIVNPAYTSQICSKCNHLGTRNGKEFKCTNCNLNIDADFNASINIKKRKYIKEINIYTPYKQVKKYYENTHV